MLAGRPPFKGGSEYLTLEQVKRLEYVVPEHFDPVAEELVRSILVSIHASGLIPGHSFCPIRPLSCSSLDDIDTFAC
jgi:3-phosphoinositide dependent protein kinase-1